MQSKQFKFESSDGYVVTVDGSDIFDYVDSTVAACMAYTQLLSNQDPASPQSIPNALHLNRAMCEEACALMQFLAEYIREQQPANSGNPDGDDLKIAA